MSKQILKCGRAGTVRMSQTTSNTMTDVMNFAVQNIDHMKEVGSKANSLRIITAYRSFSQVREHANAPIKFRNTYFVKKNSNLNAVQSASLGGSIKTVRISINLKKDTHFRCFCGFYFNALLE